MKLPDDTVKLINEYLSDMEFGEVILIKHQSRLTIDVKNRDRKLDIKIDNK